jgi:hypothetical protein
MSSTTKYIYDLVHCTDATKNITNVATNINPSPYAGLVVYIDEPGHVQADIYTLTYVGDETAALFFTWMPNLGAANLTGCADPNNDKMYRVTKCGDPKNERYVLLAAAQTVTIPPTTVLQFVGECDCWEVAELISTYVESLTIDNTFGSCADCQGSVTAAICLYEERTISRAIKVQLPQPEPPDRGFAECCYSNLVFGDVGDTDPYRNDFSSVFFQRQTPTDTVTYEIIPASTGVPVALVDGTHGVLYDFDPLNTNPDLSYFKVEWRKILSVIGEDVFTIRKAVTIAGVGPTNIDSNSFDLKPFSVARANGTVRIDSKQDGTLERINVNFKNSGYETSLRVQGFFGNAKDAIEKDVVVFSSKKGMRYYEDQITMSNDPDYIFQANNIPECISRELRKFVIFANEIFISDYNLNNHSYEYELFPVTLEDVATNDYPVLGRGVNIEMTFKDRSKDNRKTNC